DRCVGGYVVLSQTAYGVARGPGGWTPHAPVLTRPWRGRAGLDRLPAPATSPAWGLCRRIGGGSCPPDALARPPCGVRPRASWPARLRCAGPPGRSARAGPGPNRVPPTARPCPVPPRR